MLLLRSWLTTAKEHILSVLEKHILIVATSLVKGKECEHAELWECSVIVKSWNLFLDIHGQKFNFLKDPDVRTEHSIHPLSFYPCTTSRHRPNFMCDLGGHRDRAWGIGLVTPDPTAYSLELAATFNDISVQGSQDNPSAPESQDESFKKTRNARGLNAVLWNMTQSLQRQLDQQRQDAEQQRRDAEQ